MARGTPLAQLRYMLNAETGSSLGTDNANDTATKNQILSDMQAWLATQYDWPTLELRADVIVPANTRYLTLPNIDFERPVDVWVKWPPSVGSSSQTGTWQPVYIGINSEEFNTLDSDVPGQVQDPVQRWRIAGQAEVPLPPAPTLATNSTGLTGVYKYAVTFVTPFGETSVGTSASITLTNQGVTLTNIPLGPNSPIYGGGASASVAAISARNIYRTIANGSAFLFLKTIADNTTTTTNDVAADSTLGAAAPTYSNAEVTAFEVWPVPVTTQTVRFLGQRLLSPMVLDTDTADLDDQMIMLFAAAEWLTRKKQADAQIKLSKAQERMAHVRASYPRRTRTVVFGKESTKESIRRLVPIAIAR